uniref:helix-turn-helix transcriptional regulator n=1 Tax=Novacetimonas hansenii TaxID=436 RepID=UPI000AF80BE0|nr:helix-turn-helix domain-containing protein [Novacetimonas hansenii]
MLDRHAPSPARYLRTHQAAQILGLSPRTLEKYRCHGSGPTFRKLGGRVVYLIDDLDAWAMRSIREGRSQADRCSAGGTRPGRFSPRVV